MKHHAITLWYRFLICLAVITSLPACFAPYSDEALHALSPGADLVDVCVRTPTVKSGSVAWAYNGTSEKTVSDEDNDAFEEAAKTASVMYRYDPNAPKDSPSRLPWPYHTMSCAALSSSNTPPMPDGLPQIYVSWEAQEALVATLIQPEDTRPSLQNELSNVPIDKRHVGQLFTGPRRNPIERLQALSRIIRDEFRKAMPTVEGPTGDQISVLDTKTSQIIIGAGFGTYVSFVPAGVLFEEVLQASGQVPTPTREFATAESFFKMGSGLVQMVSGTGMGLGGGGTTLTGGGALVGVPLCIGGIALATNGAITFYDGAHELILVVCHWNELPSADDAQPLASTNQSTQSSGGSPPTNEVKPPEPKPVAKPVEAKPPAVEPAPPKTPSNTTTKMFYKPPPGERQIRNVHLAGKTHPKTGVPFDADGFPDFKAAGVVKKEVKIKFTGDRGKDRIAANKEAHFDDVPVGLTWHHHQDGTTMQLVPRSIHEATGHTGGFSPTKQK